MESYHRRLLQCRLRSNGNDVADNVIQFLMLLKGTHTNNPPQTVTCDMTTHTHTNACIRIPRTEYKEISNNPKSSHVNMHMLLRELLYSLQTGGFATSPSSLLSSSCIRDYAWLLDNTCNANNANLDHHVNVDMVYKVAETACLVHKLERCIEDDNKNTALGAALRAQLQEFYKMVAVLEARLNDDTTCSENTTPNCSSRKLTLRQLCTFLRAPTNKLKLLCSLGEVVPDISLSLQLYENHASPFHKETMSQISTFILTPQWKMIHDWVLYGKLSPSFFVGINNDADMMHRYYVKHDKVPSFLLMNEDGLPELLLSAGRGMYIVSYLLIYIYNDVVSLASTNIIMPSRYKLYQHLPQFKICPVFKLS